MRLIDADAFLKDLDYEGADVCEVYDGGYCAIHGYSFDLIKEVINKQPTIEAEPVRHGRWEKFNNKIICSECKEEPVYANLEGFILTKRCPNCGVKMDKED